MKFWPFLFLFSLYSQISYGFRIVAIGDLHGDFSHTLSILQMAKIIDSNQKWIAQDTILVQVGDEVDRGPDDRKILDFFDSLTDEAIKFGGHVYPLLGNHEIMNASLDFRYVTPESFESFDSFNTPQEGNRFPHLDEHKIGRAAAFSPGGPYAMMLSKRLSILKIHEIVFVHGGILPNFAKYGIDRINNDVKNWLNGNTVQPSWFNENDNPFWARNYSSGTNEKECKKLKESLDILDAKIMVVAHTVQNHINSECSGKVFRIDTGMSSYYEGDLEALEITENGISVIR